eukprot:16428608-Heterocapsa_arctica.AAC.1
MDKQTKGGKSQSPPKPLRTSPWNPVSAPSTQATESASPGQSRPTEGITRGARRTSSTSAAQHTMGSNASSNNS